MCCGVLCSAPASLCPARASCPRALAFRFIVLENVMSTFTVTLTSSDGSQVPAYVALPQGASNGAVIVMQEIFGVNAHIRSLAEGYAEGRRISCEARAPPLRRAVYFAGLRKRDEGSATFGDDCECRRRRLRWRAPHAAAARALPGSVDTAVIQQVDHTLAARFSLRATRRRQRHVPFPSRRAGLRRESLSTRPAPWE